MIVNRVTCMPRRIFGLEYLKIKVNKYFTMFLEKDKCSFYLRKKKEFFSMQKSNPLFRLDSSSVVS